MITYVTRVYCDDCGKYVEFEANLKIIMVGNRRVESSIYSMHGWRTITFDGRKKHFCNECKESAIVRYNERLKLRKLKAEERYKKYQAMKNEVIV